MMRFLKVCIFSFLGLMALAVTNTQADPGDLIEQMKSGGHILMIRHAYAPGSGDPSHFKIGDCSTQRNLDDRGRSQARTIGDWLRSKGIKVANVYSSQWCRCLETAALLNFGSVTELPALNSFYELPQNREPNIRALRSFIANLDATGDLIILVTHFVTILEIAGEGVSSGEGVVLKLKGQSAYDVLGRLSFGF
ncbi:MAG: histidine phosphatase family protein [Desulfobacteraceae bacterium]|jgi:phosphohistidine phosphatase SixA|nr:histidine phosphatase family protein [Desulfobacteraceae bacterium]MDH3723672.1 histidine phosphatase family protein [Desulfobacteraceae bacterium]MDH3839098.1 histidine phosphatase family protein [Desulfobacteraceae bacterium]MDH3875107.1 histidine phosphatase family protein [Desulfobacteraceae bacterium]